MVSVIAKLPLHESMAEEVSSVYLQRVAFWIPAAVVYNSVVCSLPVAAVL